MFGGLGFLVAGNVAVAASGKGGLLVRVDTAETDALLSSPGASLFEMGGRTMRGWLTVDAAQLADRETLPSGWIAASRSRVPCLPSDSVAQLEGRPCERLLVIGSSARGEACGGCGQAVPRADG